jgi:hypothetical protein
MSDEEIEKMMKEHEVLRKDQEHIASNETDHVQARNTRKSSDTSLSNRPRYINYKTLLQTSVFHYPVHLGMIASMVLGSIAWTD